MKQIIGIFMNQTARKSSNRGGPRKTNMCGHVVSNNCVYGDLEMIMTKLRFKKENSKAYVYGFKYILEQCFSNRCQYGLIK